MNGGVEEGGGGQIDPPQKKLPSKSPALLGLTILSLRGDSQIKNSALNVNPTFGQKGVFVAISRFRV